nr:MAG TPA: hypothetical protein [Bacteriophage sp.]
MCKGTHFISKFKKHSFRLHIIRDKTKNIRKIILKESTYRTSISKKYFNSFVLHLINIQQFKI